MVIVLLTSIVFVVIEIIGGYISGSIAIMSDAAHLASDVAGLGISVIALDYALKPANNQFSFGYHRVEILGALVSIFTIWFMAFVLCFEATHRLIHREHDLNEDKMLGIAILSLIFNLIQIKILHTGEGAHMHGG